MLVLSLRPIHLNTLQELLQAKTITQDQYNEELGRKLEDTNLDRAVAFLGYFLANCPIDSMKTNIIYYAQDLVESANWSIIQGFIPKLVYDLLEYVLVEYVEKKNGWAFRQIKMIYSYHPFCYQL